MQRYFPVFLCLLFLTFSDGSFAGSFSGLEPGRSKKSDVDKTLGRPVREILKGERFDYDPKEADTRRISIQFNRSTQLIETIDIYPRESILKAKWKEWLKLTDPRMIWKDPKGNLVEYYADQGIALHYSGPQDSYPVEYFSHFDPALLEKEIAKEKAPERKMEVTKKIPEREEPSRPGGGAIVLLEDTFESENGRKGQLNYTGFKNWDVIQGSVDLIGLGFWDFFPDHGLYVDLDGSTGQAGTLSSRKTFGLEPGSYRLEFELAGNAMGGPNTVTVRLGNVYSEVFTMGMKEPFKTIKRDISVSARGEAKLVFQHAGGDNEGLILDNIRLTRLSPSPQRIGNPLNYYEEAATEAVKAKDCANLKRILDEGLQDFPESSRLWSNRSVYYFNCSSEPIAIRKEEMLRSAVKAYQIEPSKTSYAIDLAWIYQEVFQDWRSAISYYEKGEKEYGPQRPDLYYHMASCYEKLGSADRAVEYYNRLLRNAPNHRYAPSARDRITDLKARYPWIK